MNDIELHASVYWPQVAAVLEAARRANTQLTDAEVQWSAGDWRTKKIKEYAANLALAVDTLREIAAKSLAAEEISAALHIHERKS